MPPRSTSGRAWPYSSWEVRVPKRCAAKKTGRLFRRSAPGGGFGETAHASDPCELFDHRIANDVTLAVAKEHGVDVIIGSVALERAPAHGQSSEELIIDAAGRHPTPILYGYIVDRMLPKVLDLLFAED